MKNIELYRTIEALVESKKQQYTPNKPSFAHEYCKQQIKKKKLIPFNPRSKMSKIMKNFNQLDTYVNVEQLFQFINLKINQKKKQDKAQPCIKWKSKQQIVFNDDQIIEKVREKLGPYNQKIFMKENQQMAEIIEKLEESSLVASHRKNNASGSDDITFFNNNIKVKEETSKYSTDKERWRYYEGNNYIFEDISEKKPNKPEIDKLEIEKPNLRKRQQNMELIHQVSTYLQIILENHHKKKWGNKKLRVQENLMTDPVQEPKEDIEVKEVKQIKQMKESKRKIDFRIQRTSTRYTDHKSAIERSTLSTQKSSPENSVLLMKKSSSNFSQRQASPQLNKYIAKKVGVNENFTFRNRNIKQNLMKKINSFLQYVESEEKQFKKDKNFSINEINNIENKEKINQNNLCGRNFMVDDHELNAVLKIVHLQK